MIKENLKEDKQKQYDQLIHDLKTYKSLIKKTEFALEIFEKSAENNIYNSFSEAEYELSEYYKQEVNEFLDKNSILDFKRNFPTSFKQEFFVHNKKYLGIINIKLSDVFNEPYINKVYFSYEAVIEELN